MLIYRPYDAIYKEYDDEFNHYYWYEIFYNLMLFLSGTNVGAV